MCLPALTLSPRIFFLPRSFTPSLTAGGPWEEIFMTRCFWRGKTRPDFGYLKAKVKIADIPALKTALLDRCAKLDFNQLAGDVAPLVFIPGDAKRLNYSRNLYGGWSDGWRCHDDPAERENSVNQGQVHPIRVFIRVVP